MDTNITRDLKLPEIGKGFLNQLKAGLSMLDFQKECAYWLLKYIEELRWRPSPSKPEAIVIYEQRVSEDPKYSLPNAFWQQDYIRTYCKSKNEIFCENKSNWWWLLFLKKYILPGDIHGHVKISEMMRIYPGHEESTYRLEKERYQ